VQPDSAVLDSSDKDMFMWRGQRNFYCMIRADAMHTPAPLERWLTALSDEAPARVFSLEFFPPHSDALEAQFWACLRRPAPLAPRFPPVTYGAGGTDQGPTRATPQYFFDTDTHLRFLDRALTVGVSAPILPDILPVPNVVQAARFSTACGASVPRWLGCLFEGRDDAPETRRRVTAEQVGLLQTNGIDEFHFYSPNRPELVYAIAHIVWVAAAERGLRLSGRWH
jgi:5,10-methylenetetrahydrofolate reductase